jgi:hemerythrin-like domain-containing protein
MRCTEIILQDHKIIRRGLDIVDGMLTKLEDGQRIEIFDAASLLKFLRLFGDEYHQALEETVLFPVLLRAAPDNAALSQLVSEHGAERALVAGIEEALVARKGMAFLRNSRQLTGVLRNHCEREEIIVCELAEQCFSKQQDGESAAKFIARRAQVENFADFSRLDRRYPPQLPRAPWSSGQGRARAQGSTSYT